LPEDGERGVEFVLESGLAVELAPTDEGRALRISAEIGPYSDDWAKILLDANLLGVDSGNGAVGLDDDDMFILQRRLTVSSLGINALQVALRDLGLAAESWRAQIAGEQ